MNDLNSTQLNSPSWMFFVRINFAISMGAMFCAIVLSPIQTMVQGFLAMGTLYTRRLDLYLRKDCPR